MPMSHAGLAPLVVARRAPAHSHAAIGGHKRGCLSLQSESFGHIHSGSSDGFVASKAYNTQRQRQPQVILLTTPTWKKQTHSGKNNIDNFFESSHDSPTGIAEAEAGGSRGNGKGRSGLSALRDAATCLGMRTALTLAAAEGPKLDRFAENVLQMDNVVEEALR